MCASISHYPPVSPPAPPFPSPQLAPLFASVIASDVNERQLAHAWPAANVRYVRTPAVMTDEQAAELIAAPGG